MRAGRALRAVHAAGARVRLPDQRGGDAWRQGRAGACARPDGVGRRRAVRCGLAHGSAPLPPLCCHRRCCRVAAAAAAAAACTERQPRQHRAARSTPTLPVPPRALTSPAPLPNPPPWRAQAIRHLTEGCTSSQLQKALLAQKGRAVFRGLIRANGLAMRTVAHQLSRSMLLSDGAKLDASPCLEIIADDVECTHGATVAELDEEKARARAATRSVSRPPSRLTARPRPRVCSPAGVLLPRSGHLCGGGALCPRQGIRARGDRRRAVLGARSRPPRTAGCARLLAPLSLSLARARWWWRCARHGALTEPCPRAARCRALASQGAKARIAAAALSLIPRKADRAPVDTTGWSSI